MAAGADEKDGLRHGAMLLGRKSVANELDRALDVDRIARADVHRQPVEHEPEELTDRLDLEIGAVKAVALARSEVIRDLHVELRVPLQPALAERGVRPQHAHDLEVDADPVGALFTCRADHALESLLEPEASHAFLVGARERIEELPLAREVAEDGAAREPDRALELGDGRALVAVGGEGA